jgi:FkbM family methyltransferase
MVYKIMQRVGTLARQKTEPMLRVLGLYSLVAKTWTGLQYAFNSGETVHISVGDVTWEMYASTREEFAIINYGTRTEDAELARFLQDIEPESVVWDIGGHIGYWSVAAGKVATRGEVIAFEPVSANRQRLLQNAQLNGVDITVRSLALSDQDGEASLSLPDSKIGVATASLEADVSQKRETVKTARGDSLDVSSPDVIKIDVEGAELAVLKGMGDLLSQCRAAYVEIHPDKLPNNVGWSTICEYLESAGLSVEELSYRSNTETGIVRASR